MKKLFLMLLSVVAVWDGFAKVVPGKTYRIVPDTNQTKSLFVKDASFKLNAPVVLWTETCVPAQQWDVVAGTNGSVILRNVYTGGCLTVSEHGDLIVTDQQAQWTLEAIDAAENLYRIKQQNGYLRSSDTADGSQPALGSAQAWHFIEVTAEREFTAVSRQRMIDGFLSHFLLNRGSGRNTFNNGEWGEAETMETILDAYEGTGERRLLDVFEDCYANLKYNVGDVWTGGAKTGDYKWYGYNYNDDVMWMIIAAVRGYRLTGKQFYLDDAKRNFDLIWKRAYHGFVGMLRWAEQEGDHNGTNSCINGPAEVAACYIAEATGDESYYERARELYENQRKYLFVPETGKVFDCVVFNPEDLTIKWRNDWSSTYNQGTMLGAAVLLYNHYKTPQYKTDADRIVDFARRELCDSRGVVKVCQNADGDFQGFKGILMRYLGLYARVYNNKVCEELLKANAFHAYNNMNSQSFGHSAWQTKAAEDMHFGKVDYSRPSSAFGASTALSAACAVKLEAKKSGNPIAEGWYADPEAAVFGDKCWVFPTYSAPYDEQLHFDAFSSSDLVNWQKHENILTNKEVKWARRAMWAPAIIEKDGRYYFFFAANDVHEGEVGGIGVAVSDRPEGPYKDLLGKPLIQNIVNGAQPIDQFVFRDDDGQYYMYYGGWGHCNMVKLNNDFTALVPFEDGTIYKEVTPERYVEGPFMLKRQGKYYFMWSEGGWGGPDYSVSYAISDSPFGPFQRIGKILQQDASVATGAGHHSVMCAGNDEWYIVYHRRPLTETDANHRVTCIDRLQFDKDGFIRPVRITKEGVLPTSFK